MRRGSTYIQAVTSEGDGPIEITLYCANSRNTGAYGTDPGGYSERLTAVNDLWGRAMQASGELSDADAYESFSIDSQTGPYAQGGVYVRPSYFFNFPHGDLHARVVAVKLLTGWVGREDFFSGTPVFTDQAFQHPTNWTYLRWYWLRRSSGGSWYTLQQHWIDQTLDCSSYVEGSTLPIGIGLPYGGVASSYVNNGMSYALKVVRRGGQITGKQTGKVNGIYIG